MDPRDELDIYQLYASYGHTIDGGDFDGWAGLFTPDGVWERVDEPGGAPAFRVKGRADLSAFAREDYQARGAGLGRHWMGNILLDGEPPRVSGRTYGFLIQSVDGAIQWIAHGNFYDDLVKTDDGWQFAKRSLCALGPLTIPSETRPAE